MNNRILKQKNKEKKGNDGELFVYDKIVSCIKELGMNNSSFVERNTHLKYKSIYGKNGKIIAEFDIVVFTLYYVFMFEVKAGKYIECDYREKQWKLQESNKKSSNPLDQNHVHKMVFCSEMGVPREKVITIEVLLDAEKQILKKTPYPNDYVFDRKDLDEDLRYLLASESTEQLSVSEIHKEFMCKVSSGPDIEKTHLSQLKYIDKIEKYLYKNKENEVYFKRTDIVKCPKCQTGYLCFREIGDQYILGCTNYYNDINCQEIIKAGSEDFKNLNPISIEQRNSWGDEKMNKMLLDKINRIKTDYVKIQNENHSLITVKNEYINEINRLQRIIEKQNEDIVSKEKELASYDKLFLNIYRKK